MEDNLQDLLEGYYKENLKRFVQENPTKKYVILEFYPNSFNIKESFYYTVQGTFGHTVEAKYEDLNKPLLLKRLRD